MLPTSYGIGAGIIYDSDGTNSPHFECIIYDVPLSNGLYDCSSKRFLIKHVLLVIEIVRKYSLNDFEILMDKVATLKKLNTGRNKRKQELVKKKAVKQKNDHKKQKKWQKIPKREKIPKNRLPYLLILLREPVENPSNVTELILRLHGVMKTRPTNLRPDEIVEIKNQIRYRNSLLYGLDKVDYEIGFSLGLSFAPPKKCYLCSSIYKRRHFEYENLCIRCGDVNYLKVHRHLDLNERVAIVTGGRIKIGYQTALKLLRCNARVIITTRFPRNAAYKYSKEPDFHKWQHNLRIYGVDFRSLKQVLQFIEKIKENYPYVDILINNAAQTVRKPPEYYKNLIPLEKEPVNELPQAMKRILGRITISEIKEELPYISDNIAIKKKEMKGKTSADMSQIPILPTDLGTNPNHFPTDKHDKDGNQIDLRPQNSWIYLLNDVSIPEILEVQYINVIVPTILIKKLRACMKKSPRKFRFIVNVSSMESSYQRRINSHHPHTNMAKAAINILTSTISEDYKTDNILVNCVDPGWVSNQIPSDNDRERKKLSDAIPLSFHIAAARICDPIFEYVEKSKIIYGKFIKNYKILKWQEI
ncbi:MAG: SDR family NAD(P)-dependent oxidoreductase [Candidatus Lokiarchaeota archaeon]|nr:SDR family NAD(P)-dependent oxidoreductase [Candidatus Lokiarchaeota archaeon]